MTENKLKLPKSWFCSLAELPFGPLAYSASHQAEATPHLAWLGLEQETESRSELGKSRKQ